MKKAYTDPIYIGADVSERLAEYIDQRFSDCEGITVCDENTYIYAQNLPPVGHMMYENGVVATDTEAEDIISFVGESESAFGKRVGYLIACGSGTIHDLTRYAAHSMGIPFISYPTAASVDGFVSGIAAMTLDGRKATVPSTPPVALFADTAVFGSAPEALTASGVGDIVGKYVSLFDWQVASILGIDAMDDEIFKLESDTVREVMEMKPSDAGYTEKVMHCLVMSGLAMQYYGSSRPASGAEHHLSHLWEMHCINGQTDALHGEKVGVSTIYVLRRYKEAARNRFSFLPKSMSRSYLEPVYKSLTDGIIRENTPNPLDELTAEAVDAHMDEIIALIKALPEPERIRDYLKSVGAKTKLAEIGLPDTEEFIAKSLEYAPYVRKRLTLLKML